MIPKILTKLNEYRPNAGWIKAKSGLPYLPLDMNVPTSDITEEWNKVMHMAVRHRDSDAFMQYKNKGWFGLTLYGVNATYTEHSTKKHSWTEIANQCPRTCDFFKSIFDEKNFEGRIRFMLLEPKGYILPHKDRIRAGLSEVNISINNPTGCEFVIENKGIVPFKKGSAVLLDLSNKHWVVNNSDEPRLHMIYHGQVPDDLITKSYENLYYTNK